MIERSPEENTRLLMGYIDGELDPQDLAKAEELIRTDTQFAAQVKEFQCLAKDTDSLSLREPSDEIWNNYWCGIYNRIERGSGWVIFIIGMVLIAAFGIFEFERDPSINIIWKVLVLVIILGLAILLISVIRERCKALETDKYKDIVR
jgi:hypothetical protein